MPKFQRLEHYEDDVEYLVDGVSVARVTHDGVGWGGMNTVSNMFDAIAAQLGCDVEEIDEEDLDDA